MARDIKSTAAIRRDDKNFRRDVSKAKMEYRKKRASWFLFISISILLLISIKLYLSSKEKAELEKQIQEQAAQKAQLVTDNKVNEIVISKLRDPHFITDLVRQEYGMGYNGELVFNLPLKENYMENAINSIMTENLDEQVAGIDKSKLIIDDNIAELIKLKEEEKKRKEEADAKKEKEAAQEKKNQ